MKSPRESVDECEGEIEAAFGAGLELFALESSNSIDESVYDAACLTAPAVRDKESCLADGEAVETETAGKAKKITDKRSVIFLQCRIYGKSLFL